MKSRKNYIEIMDTTLRDGEQTPGVSFTPEEKLHLARTLLTRAKIDRLEITVPNEYSAFTLSPMILFVPPVGRPCFGFGE